MQTFVLGGALATAVKELNVGAVVEVLSRGMRLEIYAGGECALHIAATQRIPFSDFIAQDELKEIVCLLLDAYPSSVTIANDAGMLPLHVAVMAMDGHGAAPEAIIKRLAKADPSAIANASNPLHVTPLHLAAEDGHAEALGIMLDLNPAAAFVRDGLGRTPLHLALLHGHVDAVNVLKYKAPLLLVEKDADGRSPISLIAHCINSGYRAAMHTGSDESGKLRTSMRLMAVLVHSLRPSFVLSQLEGLYVPPEDSTGPFDESFTPPLCIAIATNYHRLFHAILTKAPQVAVAATPHGSTPLCVAIRARAEELAKSIILVHPDALRLPELAGDEDFPVHVAAAKGLVSTLGVMVQQDPDILLLHNGKGHTPLIKAIHAKNMDTIEFIIRRCPAAAAQLDFEDDTVATYALWHGGERRVEILNLLHRVSPAIIMRENIDHETLLHQAAKECDVDVIRWLVRWVEPRWNGIWRYMCCSWGLTH